jgi:hypothetical protein
VTVEGAECGLNELNIEQWIVPTASEIENLKQIVAQ